MNAKCAYFLRLVSRTPRMADVFNPWHDVDRENDVGPKAPRIRRRHLKHYVDERLWSARILLVGEAPGYQGGHFSGMAMTSERILLGCMKGKDINPEDVLSSLKPKRTSRPEVKPLGFSEPTGTIVWGALLGAGLRGDEFVLWNAFPWHPFDPKKGILSNRRPRKEEQEMGAPVLEAFLGLFPRRRVVAVGKVSASILDSLGIECLEVRHPAQGGSRIFRGQIAKILEGREHKR